MGRLEAARGATSNFTAKNVEEVVFLSSNTWHPLPCLRPVTPVERIKGAELPAVLVQIWTYCKQVQT
ncbi:MAG: hypothetical protein CSA20_07125 [Deltaproteobacteria bacterium]|nr:MAG: hypothetical protein CSA20_07125 [Deltaproteobacteria bacterium]